jgi:hypothetical protein
MVQRLKIDAHSYDEVNIRNVNHVIRAVSGTLTSLDVSIWVVRSLPPLPLLSYLDILIDQRDQHEDRDIVRHHGNILDFVVDQFPNLKKLWLSGMHEKQSRFNPVELAKLARFEVLPIEAFNRSTLPRSYLKAAAFLNKRLPKLVHIDGGELHGEDEALFVEMWPTLTMAAKDIVSSAKFRSQFIRRLVSTHNVPLERLLALTDGFPQWFDSCIYGMNNFKLTHMEQLMYPEAVYALTHHFISSDYLHRDFARVKSIVDLYAFRKTARVDVVVALIEMLTEAFEASPPSADIWNCRIAMKYVTDLPVEASGTDDLVRRAPSVTTETLPLIEFSVHRRAHHSLWIGHMERSRRGILHEQDLH